MSHLSVCTHTNCIVSQWMFAHSHSHRLWLNCTNNSEIANLKRFILKKRHSVNTFEYIFHSYDSYCERFALSELLQFITLKIYNPRCFPPRKNDLVKSAFPPLPRQAARDILQLLLRSEPAQQSHCVHLFRAATFQEGSLTRNNLETIYFRARGPFLGRPETFRVI